MRGLDNRVSTVYITKFQMVKRLLYLVCVPFDHLMFYLIVQLKVTKIVLSEQANFLFKLF